MIFREWYNYRKKSLEFNIRGRVYHTRANIVVTHVSVPGSSKRVFSCGEIMREHLRRQKTNCRKSCQGWWCCCRKRRGGRWARGGDCRWGHLGHGFRFSSAVNDSPRATLASRKNTARPLRRLSTNWQRTHCLSPSLSLELFLFHFTSLKQQI